MSAPDVVPARTAPPPITLFDTLAASSAAVLESMLEAAEGGCYAVSSRTVTDNAHRLGNALRSAYPNARLACSYKTNYDACLVGQAMAAGLLAEVVSETEFEYARSLGVAERDVLVNGAGRSRTFVERLLDSESTFIVDSLGELGIVDAWLAARGGRTSATLGLRVAPTLDFVKKPSRFGIDLAVDANLAAVRAFVSRWPRAIEGLHLHHSADRSIAAFDARLDHLFDVAATLGLDALGFVDVGGGLGSGVPAALAARLAYPLASLEDYGAALGARMAARCPAGEVALLLEPGTGLFADAGVFLTCVRDVKRTRDAYVATVDGTLFAIDPLRSSVAPEVALVSGTAAAAASGGTKSSGLAVRLCGNSCMEIDVIHPDIGTVPAVGDLVIVAQKGAYGAGMASAFIQGMPATLLVEPDGDFRVVRLAGVGHPLDRRSRRT